MSIRDVARAAGVSHQTVSRVLNGRPNVRPATRQRVLAAIASLDFTPNHLARMLASSRSYAIGVLITANPGYYGPSSTIRAIEDAARDVGYSTLFASVREPTVADLRDALNRLVHDGVGGIVVVAPQIPAAEAALHLRKPIPLVMIECDDEDPWLSLHNEIGGELAARHLLDLGHRRIALVTGPDDWAESLARTRGFERTLSADCVTPVAVATGDWSARSGFAAFTQMPTDGYTAVFCENDQMALGFIHAASAAGRDVPGDISVVGYDNVPEAAFYRPPLTTIHQHFDALGRRSVDRLLAAMGHGDGTDDGSRHVRPDLVVRESTDRLRQ